MVFSHPSFVSLVRSYCTATLIVVVGASEFSVSTSAFIKGVISPFPLAFFLLYVNVAVVITVLGFHILMR